MPEHGSRRSTLHGPHGAGPRGWTREEALARLDAPERHRAQDPDRMWQKAGLASGETVADVGAGTGFYALPAARIVGAEGRVYAIDLSEELVALLAERRDAQRLPWLQPVHCSAEHIPLDAGIADVVLLANVLHDLPPRMIAEAARLLRPSGRLVNVDWHRRATEAGPPLEIRLTPEAAASRLAELGLKEAERWEIGETHYAGLFRPARRSPGAPQ